MKRKMKKTIMGLLLATLIVGPVFGQKCANKLGCCKDIPNLTDEQQKKIEALHTSHLKEMIQIKNQIAENRAKYNTLMTAEKVNMDDINKNIDEHTKLINQKMKKQSAHIQSVRGILTDEQRIHFDAKKGKGNCGKMQMGQGNRKGAVKGRGPGYGPCKYRMDSTKNE